MLSRKLSVSLHWLLILNLLASSIEGADITRSTRATIFGEDLPVHTEYVDSNNQTILAMFNLTDAQRHRIGFGNNVSVEEMTPVRENDHLEDVKKYRLNAIKDRLQSAFGRAEQSQHEVAVYPLCNSELKISNWQDEFNLTMFFSHTFLDMKRDYLDSAILRLYKVNPEHGSNGEQEALPTTPKYLSPQQAANGPQAENCTTPLLEKQIRITVSVIQQHRRNKRAERKKRICNTLMMNASKTGWIEIDIKRAVYIWEEGLGPSPSEIARQVLVGLLMIEVHDEEERPLRPGLYFQPPNCEQADFPIPWNYYGARSSLPALQVNDVPRFPRIDVKLTGYASFAPAIFNSKSSQQLRQRFQLQLYNLANAEAREQNTNKQESNTPYNQLESSTNYDITEMHLHSLQNLRQSRHQRLQQQHEADMQVSQENDDFEQLQLQQQQQQQQQHTRRHQHRQRRHHHQHNHRHQHVEHEHSSKHHIARAHARGQAKARKLHHRHLVEHEPLHSESQ